MKKPVHSSNLALRFYRQDGWTREILENYLTRGKLVDSAERFGDTDDTSYFILAVGARFDIGELHRDHVGEVIRTFNDYPGDSDLQFMERKNW
jgi:hypothetical protein